MTKQFNVNNIKSIMYLENDFEQIFNEYDVDDEYKYKSTIVNVTSLTYDDKTKSFVVKSDDFEHEIDIDDDNIYIAKIDENKHDDFDEYAKSLYAIDATMLNDDDKSFAKNEKILNHDIKSFETKNDIETEIQTLYVIDNNDNKYIVFNNDDDLLLYSKHEYDEYAQLSD